MPVIEKNLVLNAPPEKVFQYLMNPNHLPEFCPDVTEVKVVQHYDTSYVEFTWSAKMLGVHFEGMATIKDLGHDQRIEIHFWGGLKGSMIWLFNPNTKSTELRAIFEYTIPAPLTRKHQYEAITQQNELAFEHMLNTLSTQLETSSVIGATQ